jgi:hypothetical protein
MAHNLLPPEPSRREAPGFAARVAGERAHAQELGRLTEQLAQLERGAESLQKALAELVNE